MSRPFLLSLLFSLLVAGPALGQLRSSSKASFELLLDRTAYAPGDTVGVAAAVTVEPNWHVQAHKPALEYLIPTELELELPEGWSTGEVTYPEPSLWQSSFESEPLLVYEETFHIFADLSVPSTAATDGEAMISARLRYQACDDRVCLPPSTAAAEVRLKLAANGEAIHSEVFTEQRGEGGAAGTGSGGSRQPSAGGLLVFLLLGIVGGLILNAMPCVLPVLSLKLFALVKAAGAGRREVVAGALATAAGILFSFWALALLAIGVRSAGGLVGWGVQFQHPGFVAFLTVVVVVFALNLWGLFEIPLPQRLARLAESGSGTGLLGHFWWGLFATLMATPCSAPYLGTAVGFALGQSSTTVLAVFTAIGIGMALPYLALAATPQLSAALPRPGAWMEYLRGFMGFLLAATAVWLLFVLAAQISNVRLALLELGLLVLGLLAWLHSRLTAVAARRAVTVALVGVAAGLVLFAQAGSGGQTVDNPEPASLSWTEWDSKQAAALAEEGRLVFVDVTADWCATCKFNERLVLETEPIAALFDRHQVVAMKADWTNRDDTIAAYLAEFGRYGIPFYVLYRPGDEPYVFGELLTRKRLVEVVEAAASRSSDRVASTD